MTLTVPTTVTGSVLVAVACSQAGYYERSLVTLGHRLPLGWDAAGQRSGGLAGYDLVVAAPRTLSALAWWLMRVDQDHLAQPIHQAHRAAVAAVAVEFTCAIGAESPTVVGHGFDSARQPWSHVHLVYGALAATNHGFTALDPDRVAEQAELHIFGYHLLVRRAVTDLVGAELGLGWAPPAEDGSCEVSGLPTRVLAAIEQPARPLTEIAACWDSREDA